MENRKKILFVCSANLQRSPTAEELYKDDSRFEVRSAGTSRLAANTINAGIIGWADIVVVMEERHVRIIRECFPTESLRTRFVTLDIPDVFEYMDSVLQREIRSRFESKIAGLL
ncbi:MAG: protein tyrosine phosphatase [Spirochaetia bacterium]